MKHGALITATSLLMAVSQSATGDFSCNWSSIDAGGTTSNGGAFVLSASIGQVDSNAAGNGVMTGGAFALRGGFWNGAPPVSCPADLTNDGVVDGADLVVVLGSWLTPGPGDLNGDGTVNGGDISVILGEWGACP